MDTSLSPVLPRDDVWGTSSFYVVGDDGAVDGESRARVAPSHEAAPLLPPPGVDREDMPTILIVDDEESIAEMLADLLCDEGYRVVVARDGTSALAYARRSPPTMVLSDCMMPGLDGTHFVREMRRHRATRHIPVVLMSSARPRMLGLPDVPFLAKPFEIDDVLALVARCARPRFFAQLYGEG